MFFYHRNVLFLLLYFFLINVDIKFQFFKENSKLWYEFSQNIQAFGRLKVYGYIFWEMCEFNEAINLLYANLSKCCDCVHKFMYQIKLTEFWIAFEVKMELERK